jgi:hypothetical protein
MPFAAPRPMLTNEANISVAKTSFPRDGVVFTKSMRSLGKLKSRTRKPEQPRSRLTASSGLRLIMPGNHYAPETSLMSSVGWRSSAPPRSSAHAIATKAGVTVKEFVFWMVVLRQRGWIDEIVSYDGEQLYKNENGWLAETAKLPEEVRKLLNTLNS